jgi:hypothetical protein
MNRRARIFRIGFSFCGQQSLPTSLRPPFDFLFGQDLQDLQDFGRVGENSWLARQLVRQSLRGGGSLGEGGNG